MKLHLNRYRIRWFVLVIISAAAFVTTSIDQNITPLLVTLFAVIFLAASLIKEAQQTYKVFLGRLGLATLLVMFGLGAFNYVINPFGLYPPHLFEPLVLTTRDLKMNLYAAYSPSPQAVILGSSRSFTVDPAQIERLWHYSAFNASLTGGSMQDSLAFVRYMAQAGKLPDLLIINIAPEIFRWGDENRYVLEPDARLWNYAEYKDPLYPLFTG